MKVDLIFLRIFDNKNKTYDFRQLLRKENFLFNKKAYGKGFWEKKIMKADESSINEYRVFCNKNKLKLQVIYPEYIRNSDYRNMFFQKNKGFLNGYYFCAYCGLIFKKENLTVDHIFPINRVSKNKIYQIILNWFKISNINDYNNLTPACKSCNSKKGSKMGLWILRGFLGKLKAWWFFIWIALLIIIIWFLKNQMF